MLGVEASAPLLQCLNIFKHAISRKTARMSVKSAQQITVLLSLSALGAYIRVVRNLSSISTHVVEKGKG